MQSAFGASRSMASARGRNLANMDTQRDHASRPNARSGIFISTTTIVQTILHVTYSAHCLPLFTIIGYTAQQFVIGTA